MHALARPAAAPPPLAVRRVVNPTRRIVLQDVTALPGVTDGIVTVGMRVPDADWESGWKRHLSKAYKRLPGTEAGGGRGCAAPRCQAHGTWRPGALAPWRPGALAPRPAAPQLGLTPLPCTAPGP